ncbi:hypothetical protein Bbelb_036420 [Branchiostoma belcheri]|nr:hypothetical protein Bbelb_036420 [Branchiostoma belcheri]
MFLKLKQIEGSSNAENIYQALLAWLETHGVSVNKDLVHAMIREELQAFVLKVVEKQPAVLFDIHDVGVQGAAEDATGGVAAGRGGVAAAQTEAELLQAEAELLQRRQRRSCCRQRRSCCRQRRSCCRQRRSCCRQRRSCCSAGRGGVAAGRGGVAAGGGTCRGGVAAGRGGVAAGGGTCPVMPKDEERICCGGGTDSCVSTLPVNLYILDPGTLRFARYYRNDMLALQDPQEPGPDHREFRHAAYRHYVLWQYGRLGEGNRVVIPSCCVWRKRDTYPDPQNHYTGYIANRL